MIMDIFEPLCSSWLDIVFAPVMGTPTCFDKFWTMFLYMCTLGRQPFQISRKTIRRVSVNVMYHIARF
jgi:hypothetical protein